MSTLTDSPDVETRPEGCEDEHLAYLDALRESGVTNVFGAPPYLQEEFGLSRAEARAILVYWIETFGRETR